MLKAAALREATARLGFSHKQLQGQPQWRNYSDRYDNCMELCQIGYA